MTYQEALDYLYGFINYNIKRQDRYAPATINLEHPRALLEKLGDPHTTYPIVHITGTKGKGSVGAMSSAILQAAGYKVGLYSSPHLQDFRERFRVNNQLIAEDELVALVEQAKPILDNMSDLTWFEVVTGLVFEYFRQQQVDIAIIEVGVGGRLDATNVVTPLVSVITSLSFDHTKLLGNTLPEIAMEKAGIIKPYVPVVSAPQPESALEVIQKTAQANDAELILVGRDWHYQVLGGGLNVERFVAAPAHQPLQDYQTTLIGHHQTINATVVLATMQQLQHQNFDISEAAIQKGLMAVQWSGRLEIIQQQPMTVLDAAHNGESARWLAQTLVERFPHQPRVLVFGAKTDKDIQGMLAALAPITDHLVITQAVDSRAESPEAIAHLAREQGYLGTLAIIPEVPDAMQFAVVKAGENGMICVTGSLYLIGEVRTLYGLEVGHYLKRENTDD